MNPPQFLRETTDYFHQQIPITREMGVVVESFGADGLVLTAPLGPNHNHLGTAFGGSLAAVATLAGYGMLWLLLEERDAHVVIKNSSLHYHHPVTGDIRAVCHPPPTGTLETFMRNFRKKGRARLHLRVTISEVGRICVEFSGTFVAIR